MNQATKKTWYINNKKTDLLFIILCPVVAFLLVLLICEPRSRNGAFLYGKDTPYWFAIGATLLTHSHVLLVFTRSHLNMTVFKRYKYRFTLVPLLVLISMWISPLLFGALGVLALYWDEWHSLMQTFGFGRIYDGRFGNDPLIGRKLDMGMCFVLGLLPHVVLLTFLPDSDKNEGLYKYLELSLDLINHYGWMVKAARIPLVAFGVGYTFFYIQCYLRFSKKGYQVSWPKLLLFASTGATTILTASFFTIADGIFFGIFITPYNTTLSYSSASAQILPISRD